LQRLQHFAKREHANHAAAVHHDERTDVMLHHEVHRIGEATRRLDAEDVSAFEVQYVPNEHGDLREVPMDGSGCALTCKTNGISAAFGHAPAGTFPAPLTATGRHPAARRSRRRIRMSFSLSVGPVVALIAGILILIIPRLLNYIIALYLIIIGVLGLMGEPRGRIGADANDLPPAAVHRSIPAHAGPVIEI
jgi:hypothetical protein